MGHLTDMSTGAVTPQLSLFVIPVRFLITVIYNGAAHSFTPQNGAVCFAARVNARQRRD